MNKYFLNKRCQYGNFSGIILNSEGVFYKDAMTCATAAAVFNTVNKTLFDSLPHPTYETDEVDLKTNLVFEHLKHQYFGGGMSV